MSDTVIHVAEGTHAEFKKRCKDKRLRMRDVVERLINEWMDPPGPKKTLPTLAVPEGTNPYTAPPFWDKDK